jgi:hypothetical protein
MREKINLKRELSGKHKKNKRVNQNQIKWDRMINNTRECMGIIQNGKY